MNPNSDFPFHLDSFWEHVEAFRKTLLRAFAIIGLFFIGCLFCYPTISSFISKPLTTNSKELSHEKLSFERIKNNTTFSQIYTLNSKDKEITPSAATIEKFSEDSYLIPPGEYLDIIKKEPLEQLVLLGPLEGITITLKVSFWIALIASSPIWLFFLFQFIAPGLKPHEKSLFIPFILLSLALFTLGLTFAYFITIPIATNYLQLFNSSLGTNLWTYANFVEFTLFLFIGNGLAFELWAILLFTIQLDLIRAEQMASKRRHVVVGSLIISAVLTPPDVLSQILLAIPLICLYEVAILYAKLKRSRQTKFV